MAEKMQAQHLAPLEVHRRPLKLSTRDGRNTETQKPRSTIQQRLEVEELRSLQAKLQELSRENVELKARQNEELKVWDGLESKFDLTKAVCDQLSNALQQVSQQVQEAEQSKHCLENKLVERIALYEGLLNRFEELAAKKKEVDKALERWKRDYAELKKQHEKLYSALSLEVDTVGKLSTEKVEIERQLQLSRKSLENEKAVARSLRIQLDDLQADLSEKVESFAKLQDDQADLSKCYAEAGVREKELQNQLMSTIKEKDMLKEEIDISNTKISELEAASVIAARRVEQVLAEIVALNNLAKDECNAKEVMIDKLTELQSQHDKLLMNRSQLESQIEDLKEELLNIHNKSDTSALEHANEVEALKEDLASAEVRKEDIIRENIELEKRVQSLEERITCLHNSEEEAQMIKDEMFAVIAQLKAENESTIEKFECMIDEKDKEISNLSERISKESETLELCEKEINELRQTCLEKSNLIESLTERQYHLETNNAQIVDQMAAAERSGLELRRHAECQIEAKQAELNKHIREISERNDQEIRDMRRKYEIQTQEAILREEQKAKLLLEAAKQEYESRLLEITTKNEKDFQEHQIKIKQVTQEHEKQLQLTISQCKEEIERIERQLNLEREEISSNHVIKMEKKIMELQIPHQEQMKKMKAENLSLLSKFQEESIQLKQHLNSVKDQLKGEESKIEEDCKLVLKKCNQTLEKCQSEQKAKESSYQESISNLQLEFQKSLDEVKKDALSWKTKFKELEIQHMKLRTKQEISVSSRQGHTTPGNPGITHEKVVNMTDKGKSDSLIDQPTHSKTITQQYEVSTSDGIKTITRRKRTKRTVTYGDKKTRSNFAATPPSMKKKKISHKQNKQTTFRSSTSSIGELFGGRSLDPYANDPYAFE